VETRLLKSPSVYHLHLPAFCPMPTVTPLASAAQVRSWLNDDREIAFLDVREAGQFGEGHPFFAVPLPYSRLELDVLKLVPRQATRVVLIDAGDGVGEHAAIRLKTLGYTNVHILAGGAPGWLAAGYVLFKGVNLPSKTFGEQVEHTFGTPHISAQQLQARLTSGEPLLLLDGRTFEEHRKMTIPGAVSVPNGELAARWHTLAPDPATPIVIHCAGRTRSIIGAQILRSLGIPNPVVALENGTQGWALAGFSLEHGSTRRANGVLKTGAAERSLAAHDATQAGVPTLSAAQAQDWLDDSQRTTYVLDVRSAEEFAAGTLQGARHAPGGQLLQATDQTIGVRGSRVIVLDHENVRAPVIAAWLHRLGLEAATVEGGISAPLQLRPVQPPALSAVPEISPGELAAWLAKHKPQLIDIQPSQAFRIRHATGATWSVRPRIVSDVQPGKSSKHTTLDRHVLLLAADHGTAQLAATDLLAAGVINVSWAPVESWARAGLPLQATPALPSDADAIDYLFFVHDRHDGNLEAARRYLAWETGLIAQCKPDELGVFRLSAD
jgi:rhodanese-related sulfurtransferase